MNPTSNNFSASTLAANLFSSPNFRFFCVTGHASLHIDKVCIMMLGSTPSISAAVQANMSRWFAENLLFPAFLPLPGRLQSSWCALDPSKEWCIPPLVVLPWYRLPLGLSLPLLPHILVFLLPWSYLGLHGRVYFLESPSLSRGLPLILHKTL